MQKPMKMKKQTLLLALMSLGTINILFGQDNGNPDKKFSINEYSFYSAANMSQNGSATLADFKTLAPQSILLNNDFSTYSAGKSFNSAHSNLFSMMVGFKCQSKPNSSLRLGITYISGTSLGTSFNKETSSVYDTLTSSQTGQTYYLDSVTRKTYSMNYSYQQIRLDASYLFRTNPEERWSLYTGIGASFGLSFNNTTQIDYRSFSHGSSFTDQSGSNGSNNTKDTQTESFQNKSTYGFTAYVPMGVDFRIGKKREFWKKIHLFYEVRPALNFSNIPELRSMTNVSVQNGMGVKIRW